MLTARVSNTQINNSISSQVQRASFQYRVDVIYRDGTTASKTIRVDVADRPRIPEDPPGNSSVSIGNKIFQESMIQVPTEAAQVITAAVGMIETPSGGFASNDTKRTSAGTSTGSNFSISSATGVYLT